MMSCKMRVTSIVHLLGWKAARIVDEVVNDFTKAEGSGSGWEFIECAEDGNGSVALQGIAESFVFIEEGYYSSKYV